MQFSACLKTLGNRISYVIKRRNRHRNSIRVFGEGGVFRGQPRPPQENGATAFQNILGPLPIYFRPQETTIFLQPSCNTVPALELHHGPSEECTTVSIFQKNFSTGKRKPFVCWGSARTVWRSLHQRSPDHPQELHRRFRRSGLANMHTSTFLAPTVKKPMPERPISARKHMERSVSRGSESI